MPPKRTKNSDSPTDAGESAQSAPTGNIVVLEGELTIYQASQVAPLFKNALASASADGVPVSLDMSAVTECDGAGLQLLLALSRAAHTAGLDVELRSPQESVAAMLKTYGVHGQFVVATEEAA